MSLVEIRAVTKEYQKGDEKITPLDGVSLRIEKGDFISLMGVSGSGKSTLMNLVAGIDQVTSGEIVVQGTEITKLSRSRLADWRAANIGYIFQTHNLIPVLTAYENIELPLLLLNMSGAERRKRVQIALEAVDLTSRAEHYPRQMSGGQEQRVGIARAIVANPTIVVGDEPTGNLDADTTAQILELLRRLNAELGMTLLVVTHDPDVAQVAARRRLERGKLIEATAAAGLESAKERLTMFRFAPYVLKTLWRHRTRTMLTVSGVAVGLFVFCCIGSAQRGMARLTEDQQSQRTLVVFQENRFCPSSSRLPEDYATFIGQQAGVKDVMPIKVFTNNCRASLDAIVFQGMPPVKMREFREVKFASGDWSQFERSNDAALVGQAVAQRRRLKLGDKFTIGEVTVLVAGTFNSPVAAEENYIYTHLDFLQRARGKSEVGTVTQFEVRLTETADPKSVAETIDAQYRRGPVGTTTRTKGAFQAETLGDLVEIIGLIHYLGYACVGLVLALVATTTVMSVQDRIKEHGVLQTIGLRPARVFGLVVAESLILSVAGGVLGLGCGLLVLGFGRLAVGAEGVAIAFRPSFDLALTGFVISVVAGIMAGLAPAWQAARTEIVAALRHA